MSLEQLELPNGWVWARIGQIGEIVTGSTPQKKAPAFFGGNIPFYKPTDLDVGYEVVDSREYLSELGVSQSRLLPALSVLVTSIGATIGKTGLARKQCATNQQINAVILPEHYISPHWFFWIISSPKGQQMIIENASATTLPIINKSRFSELTLPVPPLNEQRRIVAKIEALKARSQQVKEALEAIPPLLDQFRQSVLAAAFRGDLTADWRSQNPDVEPASVLLESIRAERRRRWEELELEKMKVNGKKPTDDRWKEKYKEPELIDKSDLLGLPDGWCWASVELLSTKVVDGVHKKPDYVDAGIPFVTIKNLTAGSGINFDELNYISPEDHKEFFKRANPELGDILITKDGTLGVVRVIRTDLVFSIFVSVALVKPVLYKMSDYLELAFSCPQMREQMLGVGIGLMHIHLKDLRRYAVPLAPLEEQQEIVHKIQSFFKAADRIEQQYREAKTFLDQLDQSILAKAFRGELVPQDPNDEPASILLERIQAERVKREAETKAAKKSTGKTTGQRSRKAKQQDLESIQLGLPGLE